MYVLIHLTLKFSYGKFPWRRMIQCYCFWWKEKRSQNWLHTIIIIACCARNESSCFILILPELKITHHNHHQHHKVNIAFHSDVCALGIVYQTYPADPSFLTNLIKTIAFIIHSQTSFSMGMANKKKKKKKKRKTNWKRAIKNKNKNNGLEILEKRWKQTRNSK